MKLNKLTPALITGMDQPMIEEYIDKLKVNMLTTRSKLQLPEIRLSAQANELKASLQQDLNNISLLRQQLQYIEQP